MRPILIVLAFTLVATVVVAQQSGGQVAKQPTKTFASAEDVQGLIAKAKVDHKEGQALVNERLLQLAPYGINVEYRSSIGTASLHEKNAEMFYVN